MAQGTLDAAEMLKTLKSLKDDKLIDDTLIRSAMQNMLYPPVITATDWNAMPVVRMRLRTPRGRFFDHWHMHKINDERVLILVVSNGQATMLEDEWPLFPSDTLITKLRLLEQ